MNNNKLTAVFLLGTLKPQAKISHTEALCELLIEELALHDVESEIIRLVEHNIKPGVSTDEGPDDDWPKLLPKILAADMIIFATPIWWGVQSSLIQRVIERMDALNEKLLKTGESELANKVGGMVITGAEDGAQHIVGNLCNFMVWNGLTLPPACSLSYLGEFKDQTKQTLLEQFRQQKSTASMAKLMAQNLTFMAKLLKDNPLPQSTGPISQNVRG
jgi:multimeric flavodoxin WrbA